MQLEHKNVQRGLERSYLTSPLDYNSFYFRVVKRAKKFIKLVESYCDFTDLTPTAINEFISKIVVHERDMKRAKNLEKHREYDRMKAREYRARKKEQAAI